MLIRLPLPLIATCCAATFGLPSSPPCQHAGSSSIAITDDAITDAVDDELAFDHAVPGHMIEVETNNGVVVLEGSVDSALVKRRAADIAKTVKGVRATVNRIEVAPAVSKSGRDLRKDVSAALLADPATDSYEVTATATDQGRVTLAGAVQSWAERDLCETVAAGVAGVTSVRNDIEVNYRAQRPDPEIRNDIEQKLRWSTLIAGSLVDVAVADGAVTLSGTVGSAAEKRRAENEAWVAGVHSVSSNGLEIADWARDERVRQTAASDLSDAEIEKALQAALRQDPRVAEFRVRTEVDSGVVTLRGEVDNLTACRAARSDARNTVGVRKVHDRLRVRPNGVRTAEAIERDVSAAMFRNPFVNRFDVTVDVRNGTAYLYGKVDTAFERAQAEDAAGAINGVAGVVNYLAVEDDGLITYDPYVDPWPIQSYEWYTYRPRATLLSDAEIRGDIQDELWWSPFVDQDQVDVSVLRGVATLTGRVDSWAERASATENAYEGGATWVINQLRVGEL